ncbi:glutathione synthase [Gallaecimonas pentaromativorans]|uniref:Glutathione synthetase n=2 Tax=Gallaecimonas pentaromativorans TaxID=584787 RepID=A0A3N1PGT5_9GAMM|nr:glutathione synthase [Gallaecimonas pentaromativorans]ROQ30672.1 glutathione synthase [Gallaecimonas pentaromativorans]
MKIGIVMDPIEAINTKKDTTFAMALEAQRRGHSLYYMQMQDLMLEDGEPLARMTEFTVKDDPKDYYRLDEPQTAPLKELDIILMRKDPPFDTEYIYATYILERAEEQGVKVVNKPQSLRDCNEKLFTAWFPQFTPTTLVTRSANRLKAFHAEHGDVIFKPLDGMGGASIFRLKPDEANLGVIIETLTEHGSRYCMAQKYLPAIKDGDKRVLVVAGKPVEHVLARIPQGGETRGNLAAGGRGEVRPISDAERHIAETLGPELMKRGLYFVGLDVIGDKLTEINVTSPTCVREIEAATGINICARLFEALGA